MIGIYGDIEWQLQLAKPVPYNWLTCEIAYENQSNIVDNDNNNLMNIHLHGQILCLWGRTHRMNDQVCDQ